MGSGTTRKQNDEVIINRPKYKRGSGSGGGGHIQTPQEDMNTVCPSTFRVKLTTSKPLPEGVHLHIEKGNIIYYGQKVGSLTKSQMATVSRCATVGFRYTGEVVSKNNKQYGVFKRT